MRVYVIEDGDNIGNYFSLKAGRDLASPGNGWSRDKNEATQFAREQDAALFAASYLRHVPQKIMAAVDV